MRFTNVFCSILTSVLSLMSCEKIPQIGDVIQNFQASESEILADGETFVTITCSLNQNSSPDRRMVTFKVDRGSFVETGNKTVTTECKFEGGSLIGKALLRSPFSSGIITISVEPANNNSANDLSQKIEITASSSVPSTLKIEPSSYGIKPNFLSEALLTGTLKNVKSKNVSNGYSVVFEDILLNGENANGKFRNSQFTTNDSSKVSSFYSAPAYPLGTQIKIIGTVLDSLGQKSKIKDSIVLTIN
ncbi:MAG: hypothetical protein WBP58_15180 [Chitinophagaceae bacterium]